MKNDEAMLGEFLAHCGWSPAGYLRMNPDLNSVSPDTLASHFLSHGLRERRRYSEGAEIQFHIERAAFSNEEFVIYGWSELETADIGLLFVEEGEDRKWEFVNSPALWFWRDDVANHLGVAAKTRRNGVTMLGRVSKLDISKSKIYVFAHGRFVEFSGICDRRSSVGEMHLELYRLLSSLNVHTELACLLQKYPAFLQRLGEVHARAMSQVSSLVAYERRHGPVSYTICAVALGNPQLLKSWLMSLADAHKLSEVEVLVLCNGTEDSERVVSCARWFGEVLRGNIRIEYTTQNVGFNAAVNRLVQAATGDYVMVTNIDLTYRTFDLPSLRRLAQDGRTICAARQFNAMGALQQLRLEIESRNEIVHGEVVPILESRLAGRNTYLRSDTPKDEEVSYFGAACFFARRELLVELGPFSLEYLYAYHEDSDLAVRARRAGVRMVVTGSLEVIHFESSGARVQLPKGFFIAANMVRLQNLLNAGLGQTRSRKPGTIPIIDFAAQTA